MQNTRISEKILFLFVLVFSVFYLKLVVYADQGVQADINFLVSSNSNNASKNVFAQKVRTSVMVLPKVPSFPEESDEERKKKSKPKGGNIIISVTGSKLGKFEINNDAEKTFSRRVALKIEADNMISDNAPLKMAISNEASFKGILWQDYQNFIEWELTEGYGEKSVYIILLNKKGISSRLIDTIIYAEGDFTEKDHFRELQIENILSEVEILKTHNIEEIVNHTFSKRKSEVYVINTYNEHTRFLIQNNSQILSKEEKDLISYFILYGTQTTKELGESERSGVLWTYKAVFDKVPKSKADWEDLLKIANGRWPNQRSEEAEKRAQKIFSNVYTREANMQNINDDAAVTVMAYGLRPKPRNRGSELKAIGIFKGIYGTYPNNAIEWDIMRAIAYSGATR